MKENTITLTTPTDRLWGARAELEEKVASGKRLLSEERQKAKLAGWDLPQPITTRDVLHAEDDDCTILVDQAVLLENPQGRKRINLYVNSPFRHEPGQSVEISACIRWSEGGQQYASEPTWCMHYSDKDPRHTNHFLHLPVYTATTPRFEVVITAKNQQTGSTRTRLLSSSSLEKKPRS